MNILVTCRFGSGTFCVTAFLVSEFEPLAWEMNDGKDEGQGAWAKVPIWDGSLLGGRI